MAKDFIIVLDQGHGAGRAHNRGSICSNEGDNNFHYGIALKKELEKIPGVIVKLTRNRISEDPTLIERGNIGIGADLLLSLHSDAFLKNSVSGTTVFDSVRHPNRLLATQLVNGISGLFGHPNRGVQVKEGQKGWDWYGVLRASKAKSSMIIEHGFHTNSKDCAFFKGNHTRIAQLTASIINKHYGLRGGNVLPPQPNKGGSSLVYYNINVNNKGTGVLQLQRDLVELNYDIGPSGRDGSFGKATDIAVRKFQKDNKLKVDGSAGKDTLSAIRDAIKVKREPVGKSDTFFRVVVNSFEDRDNAKDMQDKLKAKGFDSFLAVYKK